MNPAQDEAAADVVDHRTPGQKVFRPEYRRLSTDEQQAVDTIKTLAGQLYDTIDHLRHNREFALAKTKLEEAVMWAVKGVTG